MSLLLHWHLAIIICLITCVARDFPGVLCF